MENINRQTPVAIGSRAGQRHCNVGNFLSTPLDPRDANLASILSEGRKKTTIQAGSGIIWRIPGNEGET
jgi:hypothetical protein